MAHLATVFNVMIASPSDVPDERQLIQGRAPRMELHSFGGKRRRFNANKLGKSCGTINGRKSTGSHQ